MSSGLLFMLPGVVLWFNVHSEDLAELLAACFVVPGYVLFLYGAFTGATSEASVLRALKQSLPWWRFALALPGSHWDRTRALPSGTRDFAHRYVRVLIPYALFLLAMFPSVYTHGLKEHLFGIVVVSGFYFAVGLYGYLCSRTNNAVAQGLGGTGVGSNHKALGNADTRSGDKG